MQDRISVYFWRDEKFKNSADCTDNGSFCPDCTYIDTVFMDSVVGQDAGGAVQPQRRNGNEQNCGEPVTERGYLQ